MKAEEEVPNRQDYPNKKKQNNLLQGCALHPLLLRLKVLVVLTKSIKIMLRDEWLPVAHTYLRPGPALLLEEFKFKFKSKFGVSAVPLL